MHKEHWIQMAVAHHKGRFTRVCQHAGYGGATAGCIARERHSRSPTVRREANLANTLRHLHHGSGIHKKKHRRSDL